MKRSFLTSCRAVLVICFTPYFAIFVFVSHFVTGSSPFPIIGSISTIVTSAPLSVKNSITSRPTAPPPMMAIFCPFISSGYSLMRSIILRTVATFVPSLSTRSWRPVIGGRVGTEPVAFTMISGFKAFTISTVAAVFLKTNRLWSLLARWIM